MLNYTVGDLFETKCKMILHGCNAQGVMGSGVAKIVRERFPKAFQEYHEWCLAKGSDKVLGQWLAVQDNDKVIINAITQTFYGAGVKQVSYDAVDQIFEDLNNTFQHWSDKPVIAMPRIGAGLGGGDWRVIESIILHRANHFRVLVYVMDRKELPRGCVDMVRYQD